MKPLQRPLASLQRFWLWMVAALFGYVLIWWSSETLGEHARRARHRRLTIEKFGFELSNLTYPCDKKLSDERIGDALAIKLCSPVSPYLIGRVNVDLLSLQGTLSEADVEQSYPELRPGGQWRPSECERKNRVALIVPFRDRHSHLVVFLAHIIPILKRQLLDFLIIVVEQAGNQLFNKGRINNAAYKFARDRGANCVVFHDVDMVPEDDRNLYDCPSQPRHLSPSTDTLNYTLLYEYLVGGVFAIRNDHFERVNGYSNEFWGWGAEDDDLAFRILANNLTISRPSALIGRYKMMKHAKRLNEKYDDLIFSTLQTSKERWKVEGLRSTNIWKILKVETKKLYYHIIVDVGPVPDHVRKAANDTRSHSRPSNTGANDPRWQYTLPRMTYEERLLQIRRRISEMQRNSSHDAL